MNIFLTVLAATAGVILFILFLIYILDVRLRLQYDSDTGQTRLFLCVFFIKIKLFPTDPKKARKKHSPKKKKTKKSAATDISDIEKNASDTADGSESGGKKKTLAERVRSLSAMLSDIAKKVRILVPAVFDSVKLEIKKLDIVVGGEDAAEAAISYGAVCAGVDMLYAAGHETEKLIVRRDVNVAVDYCMPRLRAELDIVLHVRAYKVLIAAIKAFL